MRYKAQFGKDYFKEILKMFPLTELANKKGKAKKDVTAEELETLDFEVFYNIAWIMAKTAEPTIPEPLEWLKKKMAAPVKR